MKSLSRARIYTGIAAALFATALFTSAPKEPEAQLIYGNTFPFWNVGSGGLTVTGPATFTSAAFSGTVSYLGTSSTAAVASGYVGEMIIATVASTPGVLTTTASSMNITGFTLTAGDWDVQGMCGRKLAAATASEFSCGISNTSGTPLNHDTNSTITSSGFIKQTGSIGTTVTGEYSQTTPVTRVALASTASIYLVSRDAFTAGNVSSFGYIRARRMR